MPLTINKFRTNTPYYCNAFQYSAGNVAKYDRTETKLNHFKRSHFITPENTRKPLVFWAFQGV